MTPQRHVAKGPALSVTETLRELGLSKSEAAAVARYAEKLVDKVLPPREPKPPAKRYASPKRTPKSKPRARTSLSRAA